ncbi:MAG: AI-2E family transporter [Sphingomonas adhaesiva]|uniref:AI-2E family transporter n=1 Tax=Sphingomonas adhaesiva TaxID=28212 RepID=UPI002FF641F6
MTAPLPAAGGRAGYAKFAIRTMIFIGLVSLAILVWRLHNVLLLAFAAVLIAVVLHAAADGLCRLLPLSKGWAMALAGMLILGVLAGAGMLLGQEVGSQLSDLGRTLPVAWQRFVDWAGEDKVQSVLDTISPDGSSVASVMQSAFGMLTTSLTGLVLAVLGGIYFAASPSEYYRGTLALLPRAARRRTGKAARETARTLRNWLLGQLVSMAATFTAVLIGLKVIGVPSALALAIVAGMLEFIPLVGPFLGAVPALLIALTVGVEPFMWTAGSFFVWQQIEGNAMAPLVMRYAVSIPPALTLFALFLFGSMFGIFGVILGGPLTVASWVLVKCLWVEPRCERDMAEG